MDDLFDKIPAAGGQSEAGIPAGETRVMPPVESVIVQTASRRRRTERNQETYGQEETASAAQEAADASAKEKAPATTAVPRFQTRYNPPVPGSFPSQGVPRPAALDQTQPQRRPVFMAGTNEARRPVQAEGYVPARPLGVNRTGQQDQPQRQVIRPAAQAHSGRVPTLDNEDEYVVEGGKGRVLPIVIIVLLLIAALVLGMLLIPDDMEGPLGDIKRSVTGLFSGEKEEVPARALGFTGEANKDTVPYQITFHVTTTTNVTDVRVVDSQGQPLDTTPTANVPNTDSVLHMLTMTLENEYQGDVYLQIHDGEAWQATEYRLQLSIGADMKLKISETSSTTLTAGSTAAASAGATLTAGSNTEPTVSPAVEETDAPVQQMEELPREEPTEPVTDPAQPTESTAQTGFVFVPDETATPAPEATPTATPEVTPTPTPEITPTPTPEVTPTPTLALTPTPTLAVTPTPTVPVTATPTVAPQAEPTATLTAEPTPELTPEPTATAVPTPVPTVQLTAEACEAASPSIITTEKVYKGTSGSRVKNYQRAADDVINMPAGDEYLTKPFGVTTFRGNAFRMNAAVGYIAPPTSMTELWQVPGGSLQIKAGWRYGFGVYSQPAIVKWTKEVRDVMALNEASRGISALKEVIISGQDGKVYFLNLADGSETRAPIEIGYALRGAPSVHSLGYPVLTFGQYSNKLPSKTSKTMGLYYYDLADNTRHRLINTLDDRAYYSFGAMDTSALFDRNSNTLIAIGTNGMLYTEKLNLYLAMNDGGFFHFGDVEESVALVSTTKNQTASQAAVESSLAMYGPYAFYADMGGILRCVDTTTMDTVWAVKTGDAVRAAVALDLDAETNTLWLYTANTITNRSKNGDVTIRRYNAMTGEQDWALPVNSIRKYKGQEDATGKTITAGAVASPVIGQHELNGLVYFTLSSVSADGYASLTGDSSAQQQPSVLIAINKADGSVAWTQPMGAYSYSSPVAVYSEDGQGWIIQCCSNGTIYLLDGLTGATVSTLQVAGIIEGSPAVYGDTMVFGTTGKEHSVIYAIKIQ